MNILANILNRRKLILSLVVLLSGLGGYLWTTMDRQEDPRLPDYWGQVIVAYPGADAPTVEHLVLEPVEDALAQVDKIKTVSGTAFDEMALLTIELRGQTTDFNEAWDDVKEALEKGYRSFPQGAKMPVLNKDLQDQESIVLAVTGNNNPLVLLDAARDLKDDLLKISLVSKVNLICDPGEQVTVELDDSAARRLGIGSPQLASQLSSRNQILPGGSLHIGDKNVRLRPLSEFRSVAEIADTQILLASGNSVPLKEVARVRLGPREPAQSKMRINGQSSVGVSVVPRKNINLVTFGQMVQKHVSLFSTKHPNVTIKDVAFQPKRTKVRLAELNSSLLFGVLIVAGVLIMVMGIRLGLVAAMVVPLVTMISLAFFSIGGGVLHQISIAALVLALGMLVDNAIVMAENVQYRLDQGEKPQSAAIGAIRELAVPLAGATATTLAAFVPMLIAKGPTASFTRSIPVVMMLTLTVSYFFAILVTPIISQYMLVKSDSSQESLTGSIARRIAHLSVYRSKWVIGSVMVLVAVSLYFARDLRQQFFPSSDRNQVIIELRLVEGSHLEATDKACKTLENALINQASVVSVASFIGRSAPRFYYNVVQIPFSPHLAQLIVGTRSNRDNNAVLEWVRHFVDQNLPGIEVVARKLEQGPPVAAPIEVRLYGSDLEQLYQAATMVGQELRMTPGATDVRHDLGPGAPTLRFHIDDATASRFGMARANIAQAIYGQTRGLPIGQLRIGQDPIPVVIRSSVGERLPVQDLESIDILAADGRLIPLAQIARLETAYTPAAIKHRDNQRVVTLSAQLVQGYTFSEVLAAFQKKAAGLKLPGNVHIGFGGDAEGSGEANQAILKTLPIGLLLLLGILLAEFNSFRQVGIILLTVPLAAAGVVPGLLIGNQPFGFMSFLGVIALVGIVVNNAIVLLEVVEERRKQGASIDKALQDAVVRRIRPILLTSTTTVAGLLPLAFSSSTLWPPLASAMISGLAASTLLTLIVVPAVYKVLFDFKQHEISGLKSILHRIQVWKHGDAGLG